MGIYSAIEVETVHGKPMILGKRSKKKKFKPTHPYSERETGKLWPQLKKAVGR